jgi:hypothetical protein
MSVPDYSPLAGEPDWSVPVSLGGVVKNTLFVVAMLVVGCVAAMSQGVRIGEPYQDVFATLRSGPYQEVAPQVQNGKRELVTRRRENPDGRVVDITEYYTFTRDGLLQMVETHYSCKDDSWMAGYVEMVQNKFASQWGKPNYDSGGNYYWWVTGADGSMTMLGERYSPETRSKYVSVVYTRQDLLGK